LKITPRSGLPLRGDAGIIASDANGTMNIARLYWSNPNTNLLNDLPSEAWFDPAAWGVLALQ
jgi:hypothetical protein